MARVKLNGPFKEINGSLDGLVFYTYRSRVYLRQYVVPHNPRTEGQQAARTAFKDLAAEWKALSREEKEKWNGRARAQGRRGYNLYISEGLTKRNKPEIEAEAVAQYRQVRTANEPVPQPTLPLAKGEAARRAGG